MEKDLDYDDGGEDYDWNSTCIVLPEDKDPKKWLEEKQSKKMKNGKRKLQALNCHRSPFSLNENQRAIVSLVSHTLYNFVENRPNYHPLRLVVSGTAGTGKSYVIKCLQRLVRQVFGRNDAIEVITPTGSAAYLIQGSTVHSFLTNPNGGKVLRQADGTCRSSAKENSEKL